MFWKKDRNPTSEAAPRSDVPSEPPVSQREQAAVDKELRAVETLADVLRSLGKHAFDLDDFTSKEAQEEFEKWARKLLVGDTSAKKDSSPPSGSSKKRNGIKRDWGGVKRFVDRHRREEHEYVVNGMANLQQAIRVFIQCTTGAFRAERAEDRIISDDLDGLKRALAINDHVQIRAAAEKTATSLQRQQELRHKRQERQLEQLRETMHELRRELTHVRQEAQNDGLTQVYNRGALDEHIENVADQAFLSDTEACVIMVDIDHFKAVNDRYGHQTGDDVLKRVADTIVRAFFRQEDFVARYGGEEFCIVAQHTTFKATRQRAEQLRQAVEDLSIEVPGDTLHVSVSFGIASLDKGESAPDWIRRADEALYRAKQKGRNRISIAPSSEPKLVAAPSVIVNA